MNRDLVQAQGRNQYLLGELGIRPRLAPDTTPWTASGGVNHSSDRYSYVVQNITPSTPGGFPEGIDFSAFLGSISGIPSFSRSFKSSRPGFMANSVNWGPSTAGPPGISLTLTNGETGDSVTASGAGWPAGANVTITQTVDEPRRWVRSGIVVFPSHWGASFSLGTGVNSPTWGYGFTSALTEGCSLEFFLTDGLISVANATSVHTPNNVTLDFQISTANATLHGWSVDVLQNGGTLKSFPPTTDTRGPGAANGTELTNVSLTWDGKDNSNHQVQGSFTWVMAANTTQAVPGGPVHDGVTSAQGRLDDHVTAGTPEIEIWENKPGGVRLASSVHSHGENPPGGLSGELDQVCRDPSVRVVLSGLPASTQTAFGDLQLSLSSGNGPLSLTRNGPNLEAILDLASISQGSDGILTYHAIDASHPSNDSDAFAHQMRNRQYAQAGRGFAGQFSVDPGAILLRSQLFGLPEFDAIDGVNANTEKTADAGYQALRVHYDPHQGAAAEVEAMMRIRRQATVFYVGGHGKFEGLASPTLTLKKVGTKESQLGPGDWAHLKAVIIGACTVANLNNYKDNVLYQRDGSPDGQTLPMEQIPTYSPARTVNAATNGQAVVLGYASTAPAGPFPPILQNPYDQQILEDYFSRLGGSGVDAPTTSPIAWLQANASIDFFDNACAFDRTGYYYIDYKTRIVPGWFGRTYEEHYDRNIKFVPRSRWDLALKADHQPVTYKRLDTVFLKL